MTRASVIADDKERYRAQLTEYVGIDQYGPIPAKCLSFLTDEEQQRALIGIAKLWGDLFKGSRKGVSYTRAVQYCRSTDDFMYQVIIGMWLKYFNHQLLKFLLPSFVSKNERRNSVCGYVDFVSFETEALAGRIPVDFNCRINDLSFSLAELRVIRDGYEILPRLLQRLRLDTIESVRHELRYGFDLLSRVPRSVAPADNAASVLSRLRRRGDLFKLVDLSQKYIGLEQIIIFFAELIINSEANLRGNVSGLPGVVFNMNYLLELVLKKAMESVGGTADPTIFIDGRINQIRSFEFTSEGRVKWSSRFMQPDCFGRFSSLEQLQTIKLEKLFQHIYIFDAKHKFFSKSESPSSVSRADFYQLVSYAGTHYGRGTLPAHYALVGLEREVCIDKAPYEGWGRYIDLPGGEGMCKLAVTKIEYGAESGATEVGQIPMRFAQFLYDIGSAASKAETNEIFYRLGRELVRSIDVLVNSASVAEVA